MAKGATVFLRHKEKNYKGETYESFVGSLKVGNKEVLISINADGMRPKLVEGEYKGKETLTMFANVYEIKNSNNGKSRKRNEI